MAVVYLAAVYLAAEYLAAEYLAVVDPGVVYPAVVYLAQAQLALPGQASSQLAMASPVTSVQLIAVTAGNGVSGQDTAGVAGVEMGMHSGATHTRPRP